LFGIVPALRATQLGFSPAIRSGRYAGSRSRLGKSLLVVQVALCLVLLVTAGLFQRTLKNLQSVNPGFNPKNIVLFGVWPSLSGYDRTRTLTLYTQIKETLAGTPGIRSVSFASPESLLADGQTTANVYLEGSDEVQSANILGIDPDFFATMEIPLVLGRAFTTADTATSTRVAIINEAFVRKFFGGANPIGKHFAGRPAAPAAGQIEIVGVVADAKVNSLRDEAPPMYYRPMPQFPMPTRMVVIRTAKDAESMLSAITEAMRTVDPRLPLRDMSTNVDRIGKSYLLNERIFAYASTLFGSLALFVAMIGLFGLMSYGVARRTKEIGLRMALGAESRVVLKSVMTEALVMVAGGIVVGLGGALLMARMISSLLFGLAAYDPVTISAAAATLFAVSCLAGYLPARRAARVDPMTALRHD
jgi:predicted permease